MHPQPGRMTMSRILATALSLVVLTVAPAGARELGEARQSLETACSGDYLRLCAGIDPNGKEVEACFKRNMARVSPECRTAIGGYQGRQPSTGGPAPVPQAR